jgi:catechol 2,3-dioxygenase-like lactoylglutathione lyase family enzyme
VVITEIAFTCYAVTDMARSRAFYEGVLGLKPTTVIGEAGDESQWTEYEIGPGAFSLGQHAAFKPSPDGASIAFEVEDFDAAIARLREANVTFKIEPMETPVCHMAMVLDPDGSAVCIHKRKPGHS